MNRRILTVVGAVVAAVGVGLASTAAAVPRPPLPDPNQVINLIPGVDCSNAPTPAHPESGVTGFVDSGPSTVGTGDPFAADARFNGYQVYGWGGFQWGSYTTDCLTNPVTVIPEAANNAIGATASSLLYLLVIAEAVTVEVTRAAFDPSTIGVLDPLFRALIGVTGTQLWFALGWIAVGIAALVLLFIGRRGDLTAVAGGAVTTFGVLLAVAAVIAYPLGVAQSVDRFMVGVLASVNDAVTDTLDQPDADLADSLAGSLHEGIAYNTWAMGNFGRADTDTAATFGPRLYAASTLTWEEAAAIDADPSQRDDIYAGKQAAYEAVADEIEAADPDAYEYLTGQRNLERLGFAWLGWLAFLSGGVFLFLSAFVLLVALMAIRFVNVLLPLVAIPAVIPGLRGYLGRPVTYVITLLVHAFKFGVVSIFLIAMLAYLLTPGSGINYFLTVLVMAAVSVVGWMVTRPFKTLAVLSPLSKRNRQRWESTERNLPENRATPFQRTRPADDGGMPAEAQATRSGSVFSDAVRGAAAGAAGAAATGGVSVGVGAFSGAVSGAAGRMLGPAVGTAVGTAIIDRASTSGPTGSPVGVPEGHEPVWAVDSTGEVTSDMAPAPMTVETARAMERRADAARERARADRAGRVFIWGPGDTDSPDTSHLKPQPVFTRRVDGPVFTPEEMS